jgi:hypothetical protein
MTCGEWGLVFKPTAPPPLGCDGPHKIFDSLPWPKPAAITLPPPDVRNPPTPHLRCLGRWRIKEAALRTQNLTPRFTGGAAAENAGAAARLAVHHTGFVRAGGGVARLPTPVERR